MFTAITTAALGIALLRLSLVDARTYRLPDYYTLPLIAVGLALNSLHLTAIPWSYIAAAAAGYLTFALIGEAFFKLRGVDGLGLGDAKLLAAAGAWVGLEALPLVVLIAAVSALVVTIFSEQDTQKRIAFGPWLAIAFLTVWLASDKW